MFVDVLGSPSHTTNLCHLVLGHTKACAFLPQPLTKSRVLVATPPKRRWYRVTTFEFRVLVIMFHLADYTLRCAASVGHSLCPQGRECGKHRGTRWLASGICRGSTNVRTGHRYRPRGASQPVHDITAPPASGAVQASPSQSMGRSVGLSLCHRGRECGGHRGTKRPGKRQPAGAGPSASRG